MSYLKLVIFATLALFSANVYSDSRINDIKAAIYESMNHNGDDREVETLIFNAYRNLFSDGSGMIVVYTSGGSLINDVRFEGQHPINERLAIELVANWVDRYLW